MASIQDTKPELKWIKITSLFVPNDYQRSIKSLASQKNIAHIKNNFNWAQCGALVVCPLKGSKPQEYAIIDGQHRYKAAVLNGYVNDLPCVVISERETQNQAKDFMAINENRVSLHVLHKYQAAITAGDADAVSLSGVLKKAKIAIASHVFSSSDIPPRCTMAVGTLLKMIASYSEKQMLWALTIIPEAYGDKPGMLTANLIKVMTKYIKDNPDTDRALMIEVLQKTDTVTLQKDALAYRKIEGGSTVTSMIRVIEKKYNAAKRAA